MMTRCSMCGDEIEPRPEEWSLHSDVSVCAAILSDKLSTAEAEVERLTAENTRRQALLDAAVTEKHRLIDENAEWQEAVTELEDDNAELRARVAEADLAEMGENILIALDIDPTGIPGDMVEMTIKMVIDALHTRVAELEAAQTWRPVTDDEPGEYRPVLIRIKAQLIYGVWSGLDVSYLLRPGVTVEWQPAPPTE